MHNANSNSATTPRTSFRMTSSSARRNVNPRDSYEITGTQHTEDWCNADTEQASTKSRGVPSSPSVSVSVCLCLSPCGVVSCVVVWCVVCVVCAVLWCGATISRRTELWALTMGCTLTTSEQLETEHSSLQRELAQWASQKPLTQDLDTKDAHPRARHSRDRVPLPLECSAHRGLVQCSRQ